MNDQNETEPWYSVKALFSHDDKLMEERIIVIKATSFEEAKNKARVEAQDHLEGISDTTRFIAIVDIYHLFSEEIEEDTEVYSHMTEFNGDIQKYIETRYESWDGEVTSKE